MSGPVRGLAKAMQGATGSVVYAQRFRRRQLGLVKGFATMMTVVGATVGPFLFALGLETLGSEGQVLLLSTRPPLVLALVAPYVRPAPCVSVH